MIFILATASALWGYSLTMALMIVGIILYACVAYKVKLRDNMAE